MSIPHTIPLSAGGSFVVNASKSGGVLVIGPSPAAMTRAEAEELADALYIAGRKGEPARAKPITSADDERVKP